MADQQVGNPTGIAVVHEGDDDSRSNLSGTAVPDAGFDDDNFDTIAAMKTRLAAIDAGYYTDARLNQMSYNDMVYAIRVSDHPTTIKQ